MSYNIKELLKLPDEEKIAIADLLYDSVNDSEFNEDKEIQNLMQEVKTNYETYKAETQDNWNDKDFIEELEKRSDDYKSGKVKGVSWEESKNRILNSGNKK